MSDNRDPAIKLFGRTIALPSPAEDGGGDDTKGYPSKETTTGPKDREGESPNSEDKSKTMTSDADESHKPPTDDQETPPEADSKTDEQLNNDSSGNTQEKQILKKPDKILPCPRCNSMDTKFCYYNNYNVNQPRHFCKNCQRYWTAGGTMRNVPVGAGRRKNKNSVASHYHHLTMSDSSIPDPIHHPVVKPNGTVLSFGSETPLCESMASVLNLAEKTMKTCNQRVDEQMEEQSTGSSAPASNSNDEGTLTNLQAPTVPNCQGFAPQVPYINGTPWPYPWAPPPPPPPGAAFCGPSYPVPFYPVTAYWGCSPWTIPWLSTMPSSPSGPNSPTLGKHTREGNVLLKSNESSDKGDGVKQGNQEKSLWIPKTLRIHDPAEAAKSSFWAAVGFNNDKADATSDCHEGIFRSFKTKQKLSNHKSEASQALHANPAALSRSVNFQESS